MQPADAQMITTLEVCVSDLRSMLAKTEERLSDERTRCDRLTAEAMSANARAAHLEGELTALRSYWPWWRRLIASALAWSKRDQSSRLKASAFNK